MNDNTILRIRVPKHLYESVKRELTLKEGKQNLGAGMTPVKEKKAASDASKKTSAPKKANAPQKATGAMFDKETEKMGAGVSEEKKAPKDRHKKMGLEELKALAEMLKGQIEEMEAKDKEKVEEKKEKHGEEKKEKVEEKKHEEKKDELKEWNPYEPDEPEEYDPSDYDTSYARSGGRGMSRRDVRRKMSGLYSDDEIAAAQQADAIKAGRISAPNQTPREKF